MQGMGYSEYGFSQQGWAEGQWWELETDWAEDSVSPWAALAFRTPGMSGKKYLGVWRVGRSTELPVSPHTLVAHSPPVVEQKLFHTRECFKVWVKTSPLRTKKTTAHETMKIFFNFDYMFP